VRLLKEKLTIMKVRYDLHDALGSTVAMTDEDQNITALYQADAWGNSLLETEPEPQNPYRWNGATGYYWDANAQMYLLGMRWYDPQTEKGSVLSNDTNRLNGGNRPSEGAKGSPQSGVLPKSPADKRQNEK
jgi:hypothetical protein